MNNVKIEATRYCAICKKPFDVGSHHKVYCSAKCRVKRNRMKSCVERNAKYLELKMLGATAYEARDYQRVSAVRYDEFKRQLQFRKQLG